MIIDTTDYISLVVVDGKIVSYLKPAVAGPEKVINGKIVSYLKPAVEGENDEK